MGPKVNPKGATKKLESTDFVGAKISTLWVGEVNDSVSVRINLNCALDIGLDFARKSLLAGLESKIREVNERINQPQVSPRSARSEEAAAANKPDVEKLTQIMGQLADFKRLLDSRDITKLELFDEGGVCINCQQVS